MKPFTRARALPLLLMAVVFFCLSNVQAQDYISGNCLNSTLVFNPFLQVCTTCPAGAVATATSSNTGDDACACEAGSALVFTEDGGSYCQDCTALQQVVSSFTARNGSQACVPCGGQTVVDVALENATFDEQAATCVCPAGFVLVESIGTVILDAQMCVPCTGDNCVACTYPYVASGAGCVCDTGFVTLYEGSCISEAAYSDLQQVTQGTNSVIVPPNNEGSGGSGAQTVVEVANTYALSAAASCLLKNSTSCSFLANLCVLTQYRPDSTPCALYLHLKALEGCTDSICERPADLPWIYYLRSTSDVLFNPQAPLFRATALIPLQFLAVTYSLDGSWRGNHLFRDQINLCELSSTEWTKFFDAGASRVIECGVNWSWYFYSDPTLFYELYLVNPDVPTSTVSNNGNSTAPSNLIPIPVLVDYSDYKFNPKSITDRWLYRNAASSSTAPTEGGLKHRFLVTDNVGGRTAPSGGYERIPSYVMAPWAVTLVISTDPTTGGLITPVLVLQFASKKNPGLPVSPSEYALSSVQQGKLNARRSGNGVLSSKARSVFLSSMNKVNQGVMIVMIVMCALCFVSSWIRTYGWMRRRQNLRLDLAVVLRWVVYLCCHISNAFFLVVLVASFYIFVAYKNQQYTTMALEDTEEFIQAMLYVSVITRAVHVIYSLVEQCNADYFVIDWERSKGQLLRENKVVPVSMWRSTFLANELHELQSLRYWHPLFTMAVILLFLVGLNYQNMATSVPHPSRSDDFTARMIPVLRIAMDTFFFCAVALVIYLLEHQIYYRFIVVHPLQGFADLCSVANISIIILLEPQWGFYVHGESIHAHSDVSMEEFQHNLYLEAQGNLPVRGLGGQSKCQTFEVFLGPYTRQYLYMCYTEMQIEHQIALKKSVKLSPPTAWHFAAFLKGFSRKPREYTPQALAIKERVNKAFQQSVRRAEGTLLVKFVLHKLFDHPPNIIYMNGPQSGDKGGKDFYFFDNALSFGKALMCGLDFDLCLLYAAFFAAVDSALNNVYAAMVLTFVLEILAMQYRKREGLANLGQKTLIDDRFFL